MKKQSLWLRVPKAIILFALSIFSGLMVFLFFVSYLMDSKQLFSGVWVFILVLASFAAFICVWGIRKSFLLIIGRIQEPKIVSPVLLKTASLLYFSLVIVGILSGIFQKKGWEAIYSFVGCMFVAVLYWLSAKSESRKNKILKEISKNIEFLKNHPEDWELNFKTGKLYQGLEEPESSFEFFEKAYKINREDKDVSREYFFTCISNEKFNEAIEVSDVSGNWFDDDVEFKINQVSAQILTGQIDKALDEAGKALKRFPEEESFQLLRQCAWEIKAGKINQPECIDEIWEYY